MTPGNHLTVTTGRETGQRGRRCKPKRCTICTDMIWLLPILLKEPVEAPEPRQEWIICKPCHKALLVEMRRSSLRTPVRLRIAVGLVAAERSPEAYSPHIREQRLFQREFNLVMRLLVLFALFHVVIFFILLAAR